MTERSGTAAVSERSRATIRPYRSADHGACRRLWAELTEQNDQMYGAGRRDGGHSDAAADPGAAFEEYLARLDLSGMWVADDPDEGVVGLVGLILDGRAGVVDPVVVTERRRGQGIGRALLGHLTQEARKRTMTSLTVSPSARNEAAIRCLHAAGYDVLSAVQLTLDVSRPTRDWRDDIEFQNLRFRY